MTKLIDLTKQSMGASNPFQTRKQSQITHIGVHHSATATGDQFIFENHWRTLGWRNGGYSEIVLRNGDVQICYVPTVVTNGISGHNLTTYHICAVGSGSFTAEQERVLEERIRVNMNRFNVSVARVMGHNEFSGTATNCPGRNMDTLRNRLQGSNSNNSNNNNNNTSNNSDRHTVSKATPGFLTASDALNERNQRGTVQPGNYHVFNRSQNMINVTSKQGIAGSWINPNGVTTTPSQQFYPALSNKNLGLVDSLKAINVDSSMTHRARIAHANGISGYSGSAPHNTQLLNLLRQGRLVRP